MRMVITGKVVGDYEFSHEVRGEKFYNLKIESKRSSGTVDVINLIVSDKIIYTEMDLNGMYIGVTGSLRSYNTANKNVHIGVLVDTMDLYDEDIYEDINVVEMSGVICKKTKLRITDSKRKICNIILATHRQYGKSDYIPCLTWNRNACIVDTLDIGTRINVAGRLQSRNYIKDNCTYTTYEVSVQELSLD